jgi:hypothetical protein
MPSQYNHTWEPDLTADAFVVSDYGKGAMTRELAKQIRDTGKWCFIDAKHHWEWYEGCVGWAFPNELEAEQLKCLDRCIVKLGARGCKMGALELLATVSEVVDVTGAGDIFMASFVYAWSIQLPAEDCLRFANELAGESCRHRGTYVVPRGFAQSVLDRLRASRASEQQARGSSLDSNGSNFRQPSAQDQIAQPAYEASSDSPLLRWYEETAGSATAVDILQPAQTPRQSPSVPTGSSDAQTQEGQGIQGVAGSESRSAGYTPNPTSTERQCGHTQEPGQGPTE